MSKSDPIVCFNGEECCYNSGVCGLYEYRAETCVVEHLKNFLKEKLPQMVPHTQNPDQSVEGTPAAEKSPFNTPKPAAQPATPSTFTSAKDLVEGTRGVSIQGKVLNDPVDREVNTRQGPKGICSFLVATDTGDIRVSLWEMPDASKLIAMGDSITIENVKVDAPYDGTPQVSGSKYSKIVSGDKQPSAPTQNAPSGGDWQRTKNGKGEWMWANNNPSLAKRIFEAGGKLAYDGYNYSLYGDVTNIDGAQVPKCISRYPGKGGRR